MNDIVVTSIEWHIEKGKPYIKDIKIVPINDSEADSIETNLFVVLQAVSKLIKARVKLMPEDKRDEFLDSINTIWRSFLISGGMASTEDKSTLSVAMSLVDGLMLVGGYTESELQKLSAKELWEACRAVGWKLLEQEETKDAEETEGIEHE